MADKDEKKKKKDRPIVIHFTDAEGEDVVQREEVHTGGTYFAYIDEQAPAKDDKPASGDEKP